MNDQAAEGTSIELRLAVHSGRYDADDDRWLDQTAALVADLARLGAVSRQLEPVATAKGALDSVVLPILSAGMLTAAVEALKAWLVRDRSRSVKVSWTADGKVQQIELSGRDGDDPAFSELFRRAMADLEADG